MDGGIHVLVALSRRRPFPGLPIHKRICSSSSRSQGEGQKSASQGRAGPLSPLPSLLLVLSSSPCPAGEGEEAPPITCRSMSLPLYGSGLRSGQDTLAQLTAAWIRGSLNRLRMFPCSMSSSVSLYPPSCQNQRIGRVSELNYAFSGQVMEVPARVFLT